MAYQNINQYNFPKWYMLNKSDIMDFCLASDERDYKEEVVFSPYIIGNTDGNVLPVKIDLNNPDNSELFVLEYNNYNPYNILVSSNYYNPDNLDLACFSGFSGLCDIGLTGIDNGLVRNMTGETAYITKGINDFTKFDRLYFDRRMKFFQVTGYTQPPNIRFSGIPKNDNYSVVSYQKDVGIYHELYGGFYQGFYKLYGYDYEVLPERPHHGWSAEFLLRPRIWDDYFPPLEDTTLNDVYPDNAGIFFYMGARAENKFYHYASGSPSGFTAYTRVTEPLVSSDGIGESTCILTCGCSNSANTLSDCLPVYPPHNYTTQTTPCGSEQITAPELNPSGDSCSNNFAVKFSGDPGNPKICVRVLRLTDECSIDHCTSAKTYTSGCTVQEYCTPKGIHYYCENTDYIKFEHWVQVDVVFERYRSMDECHLWWYGGLGLITNFELTASTYNESVTLIQPPFTHFNVVTYTSTTTTYTATTIETPYGREVVELNNKWLQEKDYRLGRLKIYVNGRRFHVFENFEEVIPRALNVEREKQIGVPFNLSWGGGTQGLRENLTFTGCPINYIITTTTTSNYEFTTTTTTENPFTTLTYQQDPELFPDSVLSGTSLSGLNTNIILEKYFAGTFDGGISQFNYYVKPMTADEVKHNYKLNKSRYNLFDWDCPNCDVFVPECDLSAVVYEYTTTTTTTEPTTTTTTEPTTTTTTESTTTTTTTIQPPQEIVRGLYLNDLNTIVGNSIEENLLFNWVSGWGINEVYCYDLSSILSTSQGKTSMKAFNTTIRNYGVNKIAGIGGSSYRLIGNVSNSRVTYNSECDNNLQKFDILNFENEFWNYNGDSPYINPGTNLQLRWNNGTPDDWKSENELIYSYGQTNNIPTDFYMGLLRDGKNSPATPPLVQKVSPIEIVENLVMNTTRILIDCYLTTDNFTGTTDAGFLDLVDRLSMIGTASTANSKVMDIVVLFNGKNEFMKSYFVNNTFDSAYYNVLSSFESSSFVGKEGINLTGYMIYGYQQVKDIIPLATPLMLGRQMSIDIRDRNYLIKDKVKVTPKKITSKYWADNEWWGDQGNTPQCVGYAWAHWIEDGPVTHGGIAPIISPTLIYNEAQKIDEWPGENYDGTSVRAGAKYLKNTNKINSYYWAYDINTLINTVLNVGPVVVGTYWFLRMFYPDRSGLIRIGGPIVGGHAYVINGIDTNKKLFRIKNSWGRRWGLSGSAYISFNDMSQLIRMNGEVCLASENKF